MMKYQIALALAVLFPTAALPAYAADTPAETAEQIVYIESVCPDFTPLSDDLILFSGLQYNKAHIRIVQHSPERENLLLYETELDCQPQHTYVFPAEPGEYTVTIRTQTVFGCAAVSDYTQDFTIENADFSENPQFAKTNMVFAGAYLRTEDSAPANPELLSAEVKYEDNIKNAVTEIGFPRYQRIRGDYNGDTAVDSADAQLTLNVYSETLAGNPSETLPAAAAACDINGDGILDSADAQYILLFYAEDIAGNTPHWPDGTTNPAYDPQYTDRTMLLSRKNGLPESPEMC